MSNDVFPNSINTDAPPTCPLYYLLRSHSESTNATPGPSSAQQVTPKLEDDGEVEYLHTVPSPSRRTAMHEGSSSRQPLPDGVRRPAEANGKPARPLRFLMLAFSSRPHKVSGHSFRSLAIPAPSKHHGCQISSGPDRTSLRCSLTNSIVTGFGGASRQQRSSYEHHASGPC